jgi:hypothetical protein
MTEAIPQRVFSAELLPLWEETFETHHGIYLDKGTSLLTTLDQISASEASIPVGGHCATIAAQVEHVIFYLEVLERYMGGEEVVKQDWGEIWRRVSGVTPTQWEALRAQLKVTYHRLSETLRTMEDWSAEDIIGDAMALIVHTAYHLGEIRQALCTVTRSEQEL